MILQIKIFYLKFNKINIHKDCIFIFLQYLLINMFIVAFLQFYLD